MLNVIIATIHLFALAIGLSAIVQRGLFLIAKTDEALRSAFKADLLWGVAAGLWIVTGLIRLFFGLDKGKAYYFDSTTFQTKMFLFGIVVILEILPMIKLIQFRKAVARGAAPDPNARFMLGQISFMQAIFIIAMVFFAAAMARGY